ncbi:hypothetical protein GGG16DRAFT_58633 [Schizophyllum commune]
MGRRKKNEDQATSVEEKKPRGNPGIFHGERKEFLLSHVPAYRAHGRKRGESMVPKVVDAYLERWRFHLSDGPEIPPDATPEQRAAIEEAAMEDARVQATPQIRSFLKNQGTKINAINRRPFRSLLTNALKLIVGKQTRHEAEHKMWMKQPEYKEILEPEFKRQWAEADLPATQELRFRVDVARKMYEEQDDEVKNRVRELVKEAYEEEVARRASLTEEDEVSDEAASLYRENLTALLEPLLIEVLRLCKLNVATVILGRPAMTEGEEMKVMSVDVGRTIPREGGVKLPDFEPDDYTNVFLRHFMRFLMLTTDEAHGDNAHDEHRSQGQVRGEGTQVEPQTAGAPEPVAAGAGSQSTEARSKTHSRHPPKRRRTRRSDIDAQELSDDETSSEGSAQPDFDGGDDEDEDDELGSEEEIPLARAIQERRREMLRTRRAAAQVPVDVYGVPLHDAKGREFSSHLRERLSRMKPETREALLDDIDRMSAYEFQRQEEISRVQCLLRAQLASENLLFRGDPLYGEVTPQRLTTPSPATCTPTRERSESVAPPPSTRRLADIQQGIEGINTTHDNIDTAIGDNSGADTTPGDVDNTVTTFGKVSSAKGDANDVDKAPDDLGAASGDVSASHAPCATGTPSSNSTAALDGASATRDAVRHGGDEEHPATNVPPASATRLRANAPRNARGGGLAGGEGAADNAHGLRGPSQGRGGKKRGRAQDAALKVDVFSADRADWADWFALGVDNLRLQGVAPASRAEQSWIRLTSAWWALEQDNEYKEGKRVPTAKKRPPEIGEWIKRAREPDFAPTCPKNKPHEDFTDDWRGAMWGWWSAINPASRPRDKAGRLGDRQGQVDWTPLDCRGPNGHLSVLKGLKWWFDMEGESEGSDAWLDIVDDVQFALDGLLKLSR